MMLTNKKRTVIMASFLALLLTLVGCSDNSENGDKTKDDENRTGN